MSTLGCLGVHSSSSVRSPATSYQLLCPVIQIGVAEVLLIHTGGSEQFVAAACRQPTASANRSRGQRARSVPVVGAASSRVASASRPFKSSVV